MPNGRQYIGSTVDYANRQKVHRSSLRHGKHHSALLQQDYAESAGSGVVFVVLLICREDDLFFFEQRAMDVLEPAYNVMQFAEANWGYAHTDEAKAKMSAFRKGRPLGPKTEAHRLAISKALTGRQPSPEARAKMSASRKGAKRPPFSDAHRKAIAAAKLGTTRSDALKKKMSLIHTGAKHSQKTKDAISAALRGKPHTEERKLAIAEGRRRYLQSRISSK